MYTIVVRLEEHSHVSVFHSDKNFNEIPKEEVFTEIESVFGGAYNIQVTAIAFACTEMSVRPKTLYFYERKRYV